MTTTITSTGGRNAGQNRGRASTTFGLGLFTCLFALLLIACDGGGNSTVASTAQANVTNLPPMEMAALQRQRTVRIYLPPSYHSSARRYPVLYMHDGQNLFDDATSFVGEWGVDETLNELAATHGLEVIVVGIDHGGDHRITELNPYDHDKFGAGEGQAYLRFIVEQLKPQVDRDYRTLPDRDNTAIMGSSMGGLISHYAINRYPQVFSKAGVFSPAYWVGPQILPMTEQTASQEARLYLLMGGREGDEMVQDFERMGKILSRNLPAGSWHAKLAAEGEHNEKFWRSELPDALLWLFQGENFATQTAGE